MSHCLQSLAKLMRGFVLPTVAFLFLAGSSCQTVPAPIEDYALARVALESAKAVQAPRHSPGYWHQAEEAYRKARIFYNDHEWGHAKVEFIKARIAAEKAENSARLIRQKTGDVL